MSLKRYIVLFMVLALMLSVLPMAAATQTGETEPTASAEEPAEKAGIPWAYTAAFLALIVTFLQNKFIHGRR